MSKRRTAGRNLKFPRRRMEQWFFRFLRGTFWALTPFSPSLASRWAEFLFRTPMRYRKTRSELAWLRGGRFERVPFGKSWLATWTWGKGPAVLLVHGWAGHAGRLVAYVPALVERGYSVISFDAPGHGLSPGWQSSLPDLAEAVQTFAREKGPIHAIVAHSLGAAAVTMALADGLSVPRVVFLSPAIDPEQYSGRFARVLRIPAPIRESMKQRIERRYRVPWSSFRVIEKVAALKTDLIVFHDAGDAKIPFRGGAAIAGAWPSARLVKTRGLGHHKILRDRTVVSHAVVFLSRPILVAAGAGGLMEPATS